MGSYESWAATLGGILQTAGVTGFLANQRERRVASDDEAGQWLAVCSAWWENHGTSTVGVKALFEIVKEQDLLPWIVAAETDKGQRQRLGWALKKVAGRCFGPFQIVEDKKDNSNRSQYRLETLNDHAPPTRTTDLRHDFSELLNTTTGPSNFDPGLPSSGAEAEWMSFCDYWWDCFGEEAVSPKLFARFPLLEDMLPSVLAGKSVKEKIESLHTALAGKVGQPIGDFEIMSVSGEEMEGVSYQLRLRPGATPPPRLSDMGEESEDSGQGDQEDGEMRA
jgi:hypothetical protein